jgi:hypothetical protein
MHWIQVLRRMGQGFSSYNNVEGAAVRSQKSHLRWGSFIVFQVSGFTSWSELMVIHLPPHGLAKPRQVSVVGAFRWRSIKSCYNAPDFFFFFFLPFCRNGRINWGGPVIEGREELVICFCVVRHPECVCVSEWNCERGSYTIAEAQSIASDYQKAGKIDSIAGDLLIQIVID